MECLSTLTGHNEPVWHAAWSPNGDILMTSSTDKTVRLWKENTGGKWECVGVLSGGHDRTVRSACFSPCSKFIASTSFDATITIWEHREGDWEVASKLEGHENEVKRVAWSPSGRFIASCSRDKSVWIWEVDEEEDFQCCSILQNHSQDVKHVVWHPRTDIVFSCGYDNSFRQYSFDGDDWIETFAQEDAHDGTVWGMTLNSDGNRLLTAGHDGILKLWERRPLTGSPEHGKWSHSGTIDNGWHDGPIYFVDWCHGTNLVATACGDNQVRIFQPSTESASDPSPTFDLIHTSNDAHAEDVNCVCWNPKRPGVLASVSDDGLVKIWTVSL